MPKSTKKWSKWWAERKIDWKTSYQNWQHPHRYLISSLLGRFQWMSLLEIGCGAGANLINIVQRHPSKQLGGIDINPEAIDLLSKTIKGAYLKVGSVEDIAMSDNSTDVILSDMALIYIDPFKIDKVIGEIKRVARSHIVFCEFHSTSIYARLKLRLTSGYNAYNYKKLLAKHGFYDVKLYKIPEEMWPGGEPQKSFGYIIHARLIKRK